MHITWERDAAQSGNIWDWTLYVPATILKTFRMMAAEMYVDGATQSGIYIDGATDGEIAPD
jgi:hypothetical protein